MRISHLQGNEQGSILLIIVIFLVLLAGLAVTFIQVPNRFPQIRHDHNALTTADQQLRSFMAFNGRLPCPDTSGDGIENCENASTKGTLPYLTLGLKEPGYGSGDAALRYGLYRRADYTEVTHDSPYDESVITYENDADLGVLRNRYEPTAADDIQFNTANQNTVDFCTALQNGAGAATDSTHTYTLSTAAGQHNVAYAIAAPGYEDSDNQNGLFDGLNGSSTAGFNSPDRPITFDYDDQVVSRSFADLQNDMQCDVIMNSLNLMADAVHTQIDVATLSESIKSATILGAVMAGTTALLNTYDFVLSAVALSAASTVLTAASVALTAAIASCVVLVGCAEIPIMAAAVAAATTGVVTAAGAMALSATALAAQIATTAAYAAIAIAASITLADTGSMDLTTSITQVTQSLSDAQTALATAQTEANSARDTATQSLNTANLTLDSITDSDTKSKTQAVFAAMDVQTEARVTYRAKAATWTSLQAKCDAIIPAGGTIAQCTAADTDWQTKQQSCYALNPPDSGAQICLDAKTAWNLRQEMCGTSGTTECDDAALAKTEADQAKVIWDEKTILVDTALATAQTAAQDSSELSDIQGVDDAVDQYLEAIDAETVALAKEEKVDNLTPQVTELTNSLAVMQCMQENKFYDSTTGSCTDQPTPGSISPVSFATGAENILQQADSRGTTQ